MTAYAELMDAGVADPKSVRGFAARYRLIVPAILLVVFDLLVAFTTSQEHRVPLLAATSLAAVSAFAAGVNAAVVERRRHVGRASRLADSSAARMSIASLPTTEHLDLRRRFTLACWFLSQSAAMLTVLAVGKGDTGEKIFALLAIAVSFFEYVCGTFVNVTDGLLFDGTRGLK